MGLRQAGTKCETMAENSLDIFVIAKGKAFMIIVRITMIAFMDKRREVMQTLLSMIEPTENMVGCLSCNVSRDIEENNIFSMIQEWKNRKDLDDHIKSDRFSVLLGTKSLLYEPPQIEIHTVSHSEGMEIVNITRRKRR